MIPALPKFLVVRFAPGAGANFLCSLLQCSDGIGHLDPKLENNKDEQDWLFYFRDVFVNDLKQWVYHEPLSLQSFGTRDIFSASYPRGNDVSAFQFQELERKYCSEYYWQLRQLDRYITVFWHKNHIPDFFQRVTYINIMLDHNSLRWFDRAHYHKHFQVKRHANGVRVTNLEHRPSAAPVTWQGKNDYITEYTNFVTFAREKIYGNPWRHRYQDTGYLSTHCHDRPEYTLYLGDILNFDRLWPCYQDLCALLEVQPRPQTLIEDLHRHWISCHAGQ